jgi:hypothetical protein
VIAGGRARRSANCVNGVCPTYWVAVNPRVDGEINPQFNPCSDDSAPRSGDHDAMTTTDYLINAVFVLVVLRQARERKVDARSFLVPMAVVLYVGHIYVHSVPTAGNDLILVGLLASVGLALGVLGGFATRIRIGADGGALARVGWIAGALLIAGITSRLVFVYALHHGAYHPVSAFSIANHIGAAAWPVALVSMALIEVGTRLVTVQLRARRLTASQAPGTIAIPAAA